MLTLFELPAAAWGSGPFPAGAVREAYEVRVVADAPLLTVAPHALPLETNEHEPAVGTPSK